MIGDDALVVLPDHPASRIQQFQVLFQTDSDQPLLRGPIRTLGITKLINIHIRTILQGQFRQDRDELTPTMKVKRRVVEKRYKDKIDAMYAK